MEQTLEHAGQLLNGVTDIIKDYEARRRKTGEKYNIFKVAGIAHKEVIMCRVLADLLNPRGKHGQGSRYLTLFRETISRKLPGIPALDPESAWVATERITGKNGRIDIAFGDSKVFVPVEVKIYAGDQENQIADYFKFAETQNRNNHIPVLYLTLDGREPSDYSKDGLGKDDYALLSFKDDILTWLDACAQENENAPETPAPLRENLKQLTAAVKSLCGRSEDTDMENGIFKEITKNDDSIRAALAIRGAANFRDRVLQAFTGAALTLVKAAFPKASLPKETFGYDWHYIEIPVREGKYLLQINYDWTSAWLSVSASHEADSTTREWAALNKKMQELFKFEGESVPQERLVWRGEDMAWPPLAAYSSEERDLYLAHLSAVSPQEVADKIINIARELESVKA